MMTTPRRLIAFTAVALMLWELYDVGETTWLTFQVGDPDFLSRDQMVYASIPFSLCLVTFIMLIRLALGRRMGVIGLSMLAVIAVPMLASTLPLLDESLRDRPFETIHKMLLSTSLLYLAWYRTGIGQLAKGAAHD